MRQKEGAAANAWQGVGAGSKSNNRQTDYGMLATPAMPFWAPACLTR